MSVMQGQTSAHHLGEWGGPRILPNQRLDTEPMRIQPQGRCPKYTGLVKFLHPICTMMGMSLVFLANAYIDNITDFTKENLFPMVIMLINKTPGVCCRDLGMGLKKCWMAKRNAG